MRQFRILASIATASELPPVPADPFGDRHVSWVELAKAPGFHYGDRYVEVDEDWIAARKAIHSHMVERNFYPPVLIAHEDTGESQGDVIDISSATIDGRLTALAALAWNDPDAAEKIATRRLNSVSVGIYDIQDPDTGEWLDMAVAEVSKTAMPHMLGGSRILNNQSSKPTEHNMDKPEMTVEDRLAALEGMIESLSASVKAMMPELDEEEIPLTATPSSNVESVAVATAETDEDTAIAASQDDVAALKAQIAAMQSEIDTRREAEQRAVYNSGVKLGSTIELTQAVADALYSLYQADKAAFGVITASLKSPSKAEPVAASAPITLAQNPWAASGIADDSAEPAESNPLEDARILAKQNKTRVADEYRKLIAARQ